MKTISNLRIYNPDSNYHNSLIHKIIQLKGVSSSAISYWNYKKERLKNSFPMLNDNDLILYDGKEKEMMEILGYKLGKSKDEMRDIINTI